MTLDILKENASGSYFPDSFADVGPKVSGIFVPESPSRCAERLARIAASDDVNCASKEPHWEGFKVRPNRCRSQLTRFHLRNQVGSGEGFDLHISEDSMLNPGELKSSLDATISGAKCENSGCVFGIIHIRLSLKF